MAPDSEGSTVLQRSSILLTVLFLAINLGAISTDSLLRVQGHQKQLQLNPENLWKPLSHNASYRDMSRPLARSGCQALAEPQALATPNPLLNSTGEQKITVSFVVGTDGRVYSPLILDGPDNEAGREVLEAVRAWRYRPAMCNGAPAESEAKVEFSSR